MASGVSDGIGFWLVSFSDDDDSFPLDVNEWKDRDKDGIGSNSDSFEFTTLAVKIEPIFPREISKLNQSFAIQGPAKPG